MTDASERLGGLSAPALHELVTAVVASRWAGEWTTDCPPPAPDGSTDVRFDGEAGRRLVRVARRPASRPVGAPEVAEFAAFASRSGFDAGAFVSTGGFADAAEAVDAPDVGLLGPRRVLEWADAAGVAVPSNDAGTPAVEEGADGPADGDGSRGRADGEGSRGPAAEGADGSGEGEFPPSVGAVIDRYAAYWPAGLVDRARAVVSTVAGAADFTYAVSRGDASTEIRCELDGSIPVRIRFTSTSLLVFVGEADGTDGRALALTVHRRNRPPVAEHVDAVGRAVADAVGRPGRSE